MDERGKLEVFAREIEAWNEGDLDLVMAELLPSWISLCMSRKNASDLPAGRILIATFTVWSVARALTPKACPPRGAVFAGPPATERNRPAYSRVFSTCFVSNASSTSPTLTSW